MGVLSFQNISVNVFLTENIPGVKAFVGVKLNRQYTAYFITVLCKIFIQICNLFLYLLLWIFVKV